MKAITAVFLILHFENTFSTTHQSVIFTIFWYHLTYIYIYFEITFKLKLLQLTGQLRVNIFHPFFTC